MYAATQFIYKGALIDSLLHFFARLANCINILQIFFPFALFCIPIFIRLYHHLMINDLFFIKAALKAADFVSRCPLKVLFKSRFMAFSIDFKGHGLKFLLNKRPAH